MKTQAHRILQPLRYVFRTTGVCPAEIHFQLIDGRLSNIRFVGGGCPGNAQLVARLLEGRPAAQVAQELKGIVCRDGTSCPDQLLQAIQAAREGRLKTAESFRVHTDLAPRSRVALIGDLEGAGEAVQRLIARCRQRGAEAIYCLGNLTGRGGSSTAIFKALRKGQLTGTLGEADWSRAQTEGGAEQSFLKTRHKDLLIQLPRVAQFQLGHRKAVAFFGQYLQRLPGYSDFDPFALEINMVCGLADFMRDEAVFPALEAMVPQFQADLVLFSQPRSWGHWRVGGKDFISVGPAWDGRQMAWGLLEAGADAALFETIFEPVEP
jgi:uncharacterized protein (TIGR03905 family)